MRSPPAPTCWLGLWIGLACCGSLSVLTAPARAQGPQIEIENPPGAFQGRGRLGPPLGASGTSAFDIVQGFQQGPFFGGRVGPSVSRVPLNQITDHAPRVAPQRVRFRPVVLQPAPVPEYGELEVPGRAEDAGPENGLSLDGAIEMLLARNLHLIALRYEIPMAQADVLTASLRNNPIFYADGQLIPYGHYSNARPGGQTQYDVNVTIPLDVWRKRRARMQVFEAAKRVTEAQFQDAVRLQIDNLYTAYVDAVAARETLRFSERYAQGIDRLVKLNAELLRQGQIKQSEMDLIHAQQEQAQLQVHEATQAHRRALRTLGLLFDMPRAESEVMTIRSVLRDTATLPVPEDELVRTALASRPDLNAGRIGTQRAQADAKLARANRFSDVFLLYQPYTLQYNGPLGLKNAYSYALGVTVAAPVFNRNQGNIERSKLNVVQSQVELVTQEKQVVYEVEEAVREFEVSRNSVLELDREVVPASRRVLDAAFRLWQGGETNILEYLDAQRRHNEVVRSFRDALVRHRRAMLDLNTAVGVRVLP